MKNILELEKHLARFGIRAFRQGQRDVIESLFAGMDALCIMPTGGGKSLCYQFPSVVREGTTLVVSPLIALMKDQVDSLQALGINAACINSAQTAEEQGQTLRELAAGSLDLLYVAPERLRSSRFADAVQQTEIQLLAIDEAHCISQWGHDFRPDYARLGKLRERIGKPQTIALTATATGDVQEDISRQLQLEQPRVFVTGFSRDNLALNVAHPASIQDKNDRLSAFLDAHQGSGIVYASTRKKCEEISAFLSGQGRKFGFYHGGMMPEDREQVQDEFMSGKLDVIVATNAFGMGIDKPDIRFVVHYNIPGTLEAYYQEAGRAGRDGQPAECLLLFSSGDRFIQEFFIENAYPSRKMVEQVYEYLRSIERDPIEITLAEIRETLGLDLAPDGVGVCEQLLEKAGAIERLDTTQNLASVRLNGGRETYVELLPRDARTRRRVLRKIEALVGEVRDERIYFHPRQLVDDKLGITSINNAIRQMNELEFFDYISPFRGRALHVVDRGRKFGSWKIDFAEMNRRKELEYQKLRTMVDFSNSRRCRQIEILEYFGDSEQKLCGSCDNCKGGPAGKGRGIPARYLAGVYHTVRIVLSGVARCRGRFGRSMVCQMLWGSTSAKVSKAGMKKLSTFGLLSFLKQAEIEKLIDALIASSLIRQAEKTRFRPTIEIGELGKDVMTGQAKLPDHFEIGERLARKISLQFSQAEAIVQPAVDALEA
ncbi:MAG: ATP-dependent DNA helicase RecQ, partial [Planctomycetota bacterium]|nr:ATP-dependent DNA helicase RecQ [Planctomycetota bacterium]